jgi:hypothetical protein
MYWTDSDGNKLNTLSFPLCVIGENTDFTLTLVAETGDSIENSRLFVSDSANTGIVYAKKASEEEYSPIGLSNQNYCMIGDITDGSSVEINFRILSFDPNQPYSLINVGVVWGEPIT